MTTDSYARTAEPLFCFEMGQLLAVRRPVAAFGRPAAQRCFLFAVTYRNDAWQAFKSARRPREVAVDQSADKAAHSKELSAHRQCRRPCLGDNGRRGQIRELD